MYSQLKLKHFNKQKKDVFYISYIRATQEIHRIL